MTRRNRLLRPRRNNLKRTIKKQVDKYIEKKTLIFEYFGSIQDSGRAPLDNHITATAQGLTQDQRVGNRVNITSLHYNLFFTGADITNSIRWILYIPKDPDSPMANLVFNAAPDLDKFNILKDFFICTSSGGPNCVRRQGWVRFNRGARTGHKERYTGAAVGTIIDGPIFSYMVSDSLAVSDPQVNGYIRAFYTDA